MSMTVADPIGDYKRSDERATWLASALALLDGGVLVADELAVRRRLLTASSDPPGQQSRGSTIA